MIVADSDKRAPMQQILAHPWLTGVPSYPIPPASRPKPAKPADSPPKASPMPRRNSTNVVGTNHQAAAAAATAAHAAAQAAASQTISPINQQAINPSPRPSPNKGLPPILEDEPDVRSAKPRRLFNSPQPTGSKYGPRVRPPSPPPEEESEDQALGDSEETCSDHQSDSSSPASAPSSPPMTHAAASQAPNSPKMGFFAKLFNRRTSLPTEPAIPDHILNASPAAVRQEKPQPQLQIQSTAPPPAFNPRRRASLTAIEGNNRNPPPPLFTPNPSPRSLNSMKLRKIQGAFSVDTTTVKAPQDIYNEIERVLNECNIQFKVKNGGCVFKCKQDPKMDSVDKDELHFEIEICQISGLNMNAIKFKRVKGDTWDYRVCCKSLMDKMKL
eukprot:Phypoly_transcript_04189.p1 GENE.Phypoly_transcript_04189~~Phypoly_transcript_04189.p1  ORF type:complete len:385 (+),score=98.47 Phypoly_transcript_04189:965-2119(+)